MSTDQSSPSLPPPSSSSTSTTLPVSSPAAAGGARVRRSPVSEPPSSSRQKKSRGRSIPIAFPPLFQPHTSTSLIPSTAEGKPIPVDGSTAAGRDSALRELNSHFPSRHQYAKSTGAQSTTYSQPVIVRTYSGPSSRPVSASRGGTVIGIGVGGGRPAPSATSGASAVVRRIIPFASKPTGQQPGMLSIARAKAKRKGESGPDEMGTRLPPVEAFTFKSFMENIEAEEGHSINADLDRIAEICARSRYSLSNQYEVHKAPHGSGDSFLNAVSSSKNQPPIGPTLQAVSSDDERNITRQRRRRGGGRRSIAVGTLETIMSSSRSSDEDKSKKKKSAAEIADEVRGRAAARRESGNSSPISSMSEDDGAVLQQEEDKKLARKKSASFATAVIENTRHHTDPADTSSPRSSAHALLSDPALPQTSTSHLEVRPAPEDMGLATNPMGSQSRHPVQLRQTSFPEVDAKPQGGILSSLSGWIMWKSGGEESKASTTAKSEAEGSLRELLKTTDSKTVKGKGVDRSG